MNNKFFEVTVSNRMTDRREEFYFTTKEKAETFIEKVNNKKGIYHIYTELYGIREVTLNIDVDEI
jgi:hypothetical protein